MQLYAADCKLDIAINDIDTISQWCKKNVLPLNGSKCNQMIYTPSIINQLIHFKHLGVILDPKLTFRTPIYSIISQPNRKLGSIVSNAKLFSNLHSLQILWQYLNCSMNQLCGTLAIKLNLEIPTEPVERFQVKRLHTRPAYSDVFL